MRTVTIPVQQGYIHLTVSWSGIRNIVSWLLLGVFAWGSWLLWSSLLAALWAGQQFPGATALLVLGAAFPVYRGIQFHKQASTKKDGAFVVPPVIRWRLRALVALAVMNELPNLVGIYKALANHLGGVVPWMPQDYMTLMMGGFAGMAIAGAGLLRWASLQAVLFHWAVSWRVFPVVVSGAAVWTAWAAMPLDAAQGMLLIGVQAWLLVAMQQLDIGLQRRNKPELNTVFRRGLWALSAESLNVAACTFAVCALVFLG